MLPRHDAKNFTDQKLMKAAQNGEMEAFRLLVGRYQNRVFSVANRILNNPEDAKDVTQEVFVRLFHKREQFNTRNKFYTWLYRIVVNLCYDYLRKYRRFVHCSIEEMPQNTAELFIPANDCADEIHDKVDELLLLLSTPQKTAFILREIEGFSCKEIARIMGRPAGTVRSYLFHARKKLKDLIEKKYPEFLEGHSHEVQTG
ncbi:MAG: RNA polymerase sigma factor [bacterium]